MSSLLLLAAPIALLATVLFLSLTLSEAQYRTMLRQREEELALMKAEFLKLEEEWQRRLAEVECLLQVEHAELELIQRERDWERAHRQRAEAERNGLRADLIELQYRLHQTPEIPHGHEPDADTVVRIAVTSNGHVSAAYG